MKKGTSKAMGKALAITGLALSFGGIFTSQHVHDTLAKEKDSIQRIEGEKGLNYIKDNKSITIMEDSDGHPLVMTEEAKPVTKAMTIKASSVKADDTKSETKKEEKSEPKKEKKSKDQVVKEVINGDYGSGKERVNKLKSEGYDASEIQKMVNDKMPKPQPKPQPKQEVKSKESNNTTSNTNSNNNNNNNQAQESAPQSSKSNVIKAFPHGTFKSYMAWTALSPSSPQGKLSARATADPSTAIMKADGRYLVALGFAYADSIGQHIDIVMESGQVIPAIVGDWKAKEHTDANNSASLNNGSIIEFIVSSNADAGRAVNGSGNYNTIFSGKVKEFRK